MTPEEEKRINDRFERIEENLEKVSISLERMETNFVRMQANVIQMQANVEGFYNLMTGAFDRLEKILERHMSDGHGSEGEEEES
jgi:ribosome-associated translation inhibitor RaiA